MCDASDFLGGGEVTQTEGFSAVAAGYHHSLALGYDGTVWTWGLSVLETAHSCKPRKVLELQDVAAISAGLFHNVVLKNDGTVWSWGKDVFKGKNTTYSKRHSPKQVGDLERMVAVSAGDTHNLALRDDGTVWAWGSNDCSQLGSEQAEPTVEGILVDGAEGIVSISAGSYHNLALRNDGTIWGWGFNYNRLFDPGTDEILHPIPSIIAGLPHVTSISAGRYHNAVIGDGTVWTWGNYDYGEHDKSIIESGIKPMRLSGLPNDLVKVSSGYGQNLVLSNTGTLWAWGQNNSEQQSVNGSIEKHLVPRQVPGLVKVIDMSVGETHNLALDENNVIWAWGSNQYGELGNDVDDLSPVPIRVSWPT